MSIANAPIAAADDVAGLGNKIHAYIEQARALAADGLTVAEFGELLLGLMRISVAAADSFPVEGAEKKVWVMNAVGLLFDTVADSLVPYYVRPFWAMFRPGVRSLVLHLADGAIESILPLVRAAA